MTNKKLEEKIEHKLDLDNKKKSFA